MSASRSDSWAAKTSAGDMQLRTRKKRGFEKTEAALPLTKPSTSLAMKAVDVVGLLSYFGKRNPLPRPVRAGDVVWMLDNVAYKSGSGDSWQAEFVSAVFEGEPKCAVVDVVQVIARLISLADDAQELATIEERLMPFLWDVRAGRRFTAVHADKKFVLGPTDSKGISSDIVRLPPSAPGSITRTSATVPAGVHGLLQSWTYFAEPEGWSVVSDIDDTIKVTLTGDPIGILHSTFVSKPTPIQGMPELYAALKAMLPHDTPWFYVSASPYNLYPFLRDFRNAYYPPGAIMLRETSWRTIGGLLSALTRGTGEYKVERFTKIHSWFPKRKMIFIGDSTQSDPESYGELCRLFPGWVKCILIRKVLDIAAVGIEEKNEPERFEVAFKGIPRDIWHVFEKPEECNEILRDLIQHDR
ncbi:related to actin cytoskeleton organization and biogenesis [Cephalotrichum gorgonifer]|uniref:Related to actin cytoskeleton organization and biogenesis n=1 Tax=Cephalotrichum gorgonifer TaxID=2041049 RepID=A0AAE8N4Q0_9PEZI|nr:related to actin cytoskeleton organization and biogenesis [Cephalotrichum gorgonifer]